MTFTLHPQLESDTLFIKDFPISRVLLMNDSRVPWFILVPRRMNMTEIYQLNFEEQLQLLKEINIIAKWAHHFFAADKMNIAALGNSVAQLHIHVIARHKQDFAWPKPVWGLGEREIYTSQAAEQLIKEAELVTVANNI